MFRKIRWAVYNLFNPICELCHVRNNWVIAVAEVRLTVCKKCGKKRFKDV